jgi:MYXO-CTERM domain-containing protein
MELSKPVTASGWATVLLHNGDGIDHVGNVQSWMAGRSPSAILAAEQTAWSSWVTAPPASANASAAEAAIDAQAQVTLRMGQVREPGAPYGQILAAVAPGAWNIAWVRDMAYSVAGLVASGHTAEAKAALQFQLSSTVGTYQSYVGFPYAISVVRYFGNGTEDSDSNNDGPNVEFDGFGLFLWSLDQYVTATNDTAFLSANWPTIKAKIADVLVDLQEPSGLIAPDSSIWEVHWMGQQRHFTYTSLTAANGLCAASHLASLMSDSTDKASYLAAGQKTRDAIITSERAADGTLAQSTEGLAIGSLWLDSATLEAINFGLINPKGRTALATLASMKNGLVPQSGRGFMRSDVGDTYSSEEWVFVDLRSARAFELAGDTTTSASTFAWNVAQATDNFGELSELHNPVTAAYDGQSPMVGFGGGAYVLRLATRGAAGTEVCGSYAVEPAVDGGVDGTDGGDADGGDLGFTGDASLPPLEDGGARSDGGATVTSGGGDSGGCATSGRGGESGENAFAWAGLAMALGALTWRRKSR